MPLSTFTPSINPTPGTRFAPKINVLEAEFGDGYSQTSPAGLNHIKRTVSLRWNGLTQAQFEELNAFFENLGGYQLFYYQPRGHPMPFKWVCKEWSGSDAAPWTFDAKLEQRFSGDI